MEGLDSHITIFDIQNGKKNNKRLINIYRSFNPNGESAKELFIRQLSVIKNAFNNETVIMGDLNLDYNKKCDVGYQRRDYFDLFEEKLGEFNLLQLVNFDTWSRMVGSTLRSSILDHIYVSNVTLIKNVNGKSMCFGDHKLILADLCISRPAQIKSKKEFLV